MARAGLRLPAIYRVFFLLIEPISALLGAYFCHLRQAHYLELLQHTPNGHPPSHADSSMTTATSVALSQLSNMYFFFAINEALVLRSTWDLRVWKTVLTVLLLADFGHLYSMKELGLSIFYDVSRWNASDLGNIPFVYAGATMRMCFLAGIGLGERQIKKRE